MPADRRKKKPGNSRLSDAWRITAARGLRSFAYGLLSVLLGIALSAAGLSPAAIGAIITVSLIGDFLGTYLIGIVADRWGRRRTLVGLALLMAATGVTFGLTDFYPLLLLAALFGTLGTTASETAPFLPIEQAMLAQIGSPERRTSLFARYNLAASFAGALGALAAGLPDLLARAGLPASMGIRLMFGVYAALALLVGVLALGLSSAVEAPSDSARETARRWRLVPALGRLAGHRPQALGALQPGCAGGRPDRAEPDGALFPPAFWRAACPAGRALLRSQYVQRAFVSGRSGDCPTHRAAQHDGLHPSAFQRLTGAGPLHAHLPTGRRGLAAASVAFADGCTHPSSLHNGPRRARRAYRLGQRHFAGAQRGRKRQPGLLRPALARASPRAWPALYHRGRPQGYARPGPLGRLPPRSHRREAHRKPDAGFTLKLSHQRRQQLRELFGNKQRQGG
ncbi:MAG TPA: MFS transporter [Ktedonobacterales bacterium]